PLGEHTIRQAMSAPAAIPAISRPSRQGTTRRGFVSVIMPCYDAAPYLKQAIESVLRQSYGNLELIFVDDGSNDGSVNIAADFAEHHPGRMTMLRTNRQGPYPARNVGLSRARGEFIAFLDADDYWAPDFVEKLHSALIATDAVLAYC